MLHSIIRTNKKSVIAMMVAVGFVFSAPTSAYAATQKQIFIQSDGMLHNMQLKPYRNNGTVVASLVDLMELLEFNSYEINEADNSISFTINKMNRKVVLNLNSNTATVNNSKIKMPVPLQLIDGNYIVPVRFIAELLGYSVSWDNSLQTVLIDTKADDYSVIDIYNTANELQYTSQLTVAEVIKKMNKNSTTYSKTLKSIEDNQETYDDLIDDYKFDNLHGHSSDVVLMNRGIQLEQIEVGIEQAKVGLKRADLGNSFLIASTVKNLEKVRINILLLETQYEIDVDALKNMELKLTLGLETEQNIKTAKLNLEQSQITIEKAKTSYASAILDFNNTIGLSPTENAEIILKELVEKHGLDESPIAIPDIERYIINSVSTSAALETERLNKYMVQYTTNEYYALNEWIRKEADRDDRTDIPKSKDIDLKLKNAELDYDNKVKDYGNKIRTAFNNLKSLEETYASLKIEYEKQVDLYKKISINYRVGQATIFDLQKVELALLNAELSFVSNRIDYSLQKYQLMNPDLL